MKKMWILIGFIIVIPLLYFRYFYLPTVPSASISTKNSTYVIKAKAYQYSKYGKNISKEINYQNVTELNTQLESEPERKVHTYERITYKNEAATTDTNVSLFSVEQNTIVDFLGSKTTYQAVEDPGHYILLYTSEFEQGKIADYFVKLNVIN